MKKRGLVFLLLLAFVGLYLSLPTVVDLASIPKASRPWYLKLLPERQLKVGLDLRGGIHLVLGVDVDKAVDHELERYAVDLRDQLQKEKVAFQTVEKNWQQPELNVELKDSKDEKRLQEFIKRDFDVLTYVRNEGDRKLVYKMNADRQTQLESDTIQQALETIRNRVDQFGVSEPEIATQGRTRILIQLPGLDDPERARQLIGKTAQLEFKLVNESIADAELFRLVEGAKQGIRERLGAAHEVTPLEITEELKDKLPQGTQVLFGEEKDQKNRQVVTQPYVLERKILLTGEMLDDAHVSQGGDFNEPVVAIRFNPRGADIFEKVTRANVKRRLAIVLDDKVTSAPVIQGPIPGGRAQITLGTLKNQRAMVEEARDLVVVLRAGALPAPVEILENRSVGPSLGSDSIRMGSKAVLLGSLAVFFFMLLYYRIPGAIANLGLIYNLLFMIAILAGFEGTLTLPGIAGLVLTLGMAVDANIIIYERIREEIGLGKPLENAVREGFDRAHLTILDANLTTLIAGLVLLQFGSGPTKGFAVMLIIGLFTSYLTSIWVSRLAFSVLLQRGSWPNLFTAKT